MRDFYEWVFDLRTPDWVAGVFMITCIAVFMAYLVLVINVFIAGEAFGGFLLLFTPAGLAWRAVLLEWRNRK